MQNYSTVTDEFIGLEFHIDPYREEVVFFICYLSLKEKNERDLINKQIRNQYFPSKVSKFEVNYYVVD